MPSVKSQHEVNRQMELDLVKSIWKEIRTHLESERAQIYEEIRNYPPPIPACDLQFNHLLEERARISQELSQLDALSKESLTRRDYIKLIDEFIRSSSYISDEAEQKIRSFFKQRPSHGRSPMG